MDNMTAEQAEKRLIDAVVAMTNFIPMDSPPIDAVFNELNAARESLFGEIKQVVAALSAPRVPEGWQHEAARWLEAQAVEQEQINKAHPRHAEACRSWRDHPVRLRLLADKLLATAPPSPEPQAEQTCTSCCCDEEGIRACCPFCNTQSDADCAAPEPEPLAHVFPDDLERLRSSECAVNAYSVEMGDPDRGETVPLYEHAPRGDADFIAIPKNLRRLSNFEQYGQQVINDLRNRVAELQIEKEHLLRHCAASELAWRDDDEDSISDSWRKLPECLRKEVNDAAERLDTEEQQGCEDDG